MARPTKYSKERGEKIAKLIKGGNYANQAAQACGVNESTFYRWIARGKDVEKQYADYFEQERVWEEMTDEERTENPHLKPLASEAPSEDDRGFYLFCKLIKKSEAEAEAAAVVQIKAAAASGTWQAAAWFLERKFKDRWARTDKVDGTITHQIGIGASEEELEAARARLEAARSLPAATDPSPTVIDVEAEEIEEN